MWRGIGEKRSGDNTKKEQRERERERKEKKYWDILILLSGLYTKPVIISALVNIFSHLVCSCS